MPQTALDCVVSGAEVGHRVATAAGRNGTSRTRLAVSSRALSPRALGRYRPSLRRISAVRVSQRGAAGGAAAATAATAGASVLVLEAAGLIGSTTAKSGGVMCTSDRPAADRRSRPRRRLRRARRRAHPHDARGRRRSDRPARSQRRGQDHHPVDHRRRAGPARRRHRSACRSGARLGQRPSLAAGWHWCPTTGQSSRS